MESLKLRKLRELGVARMGSYLDSLRQPVRGFPPWARRAAPFRDAEVDPRQFQNRYEVASYSMTCFDRQTSM